MDFCVEPLIFLLRSAPTLESLVEKIRLFTICNERNVGVLNEATIDGDSPFQREGGKEGERERLRETETYRQKEA